MDLKQPVCNLLDLPLELLLLICEFLNELEIYRFSKLNRRIYEQFDGKWFFDRSAPRPADSALLLAAEHNNLRAVRKAISEGADINTCDPVGKFTPLIVASEENRTNIIRCLLDQPGIDINASNRSGHTALHYACRWGYTDIASCLLHHPGIDVNALNKFGNQTALQLASEYGHTEVIEKLKGFPNIQ